MPSLSSDHRLRDVPRRRDAQRTRDRLLDAAGELLESSGPHFTLPDLARQAGVGTATVYRHFTDQGDLLAAFENRSVAGLIEAIKAVPADLPVKTRYDRICAAWVDRGAREAAATRYLRSPRGYLERVESGDAGLIGLDRLLRTTIEALVQAGTIPEQDRSAAVLTWVTLFDERVVVDLGRAHGWTVRHIADHLSATVLNALGGR